MNTLDWLELHERGFDLATRVAYEKAAREGRLREFQQEMIRAGHRIPPKAARMLTEAEMESLRTSAREADNFFKRQFERGSTES